MSTLKIASNTIFGKNPLTFASIITGASIIMHFVSIILYSSKDLVSFNYLAYRLPFRELILNVFTFFNNQYPIAKETIVFLLYFSLVFAVLYGISHLLITKFRILGWGILCLYLLTLIPVFDTSKMFI